MSYQATRYVLAHVVTDGPIERLVALVLADYARGEAKALGDGRRGWRCWPSIPTIAREARIADRRTVQRALRRLEKTGVISTTLGGGRTRPSTYVILYERAAREPTLSRTETPARAPALYDPPKRLHESPPFAGERAADGAPKGVHENPPEQYPKQIRKGFTDTHEAYADREAYDEGLARARSALHGGEGER